MNELQKLAQQLKPYIVPWIPQPQTISSSGGSGGSGGGLTVHGLSSAFHTGTLADAQAPQFLKRDGSRSLTGNLSVDTGITIDGIDISSPGVGLGVSGSQLVVNQAYGFVWTAEHQFSAGLKATHVGAVSSLTIDPSSDLTLTPGNKVYMTAGKEIRTTDWVSGFLGAGWGITNVSGASLLDIRKIQVEELHAYVFIADIERVRVGETFVTQSMGILKNNLTTPAVGSTTTLTIEDIPQAAGAAFLNNEWVLMQLVDRSGGGITIARAWGQVSTYVDGTGANEGTQSYTYTHRSGTVGLTFKEGSYVLSFGLSGDGYIHESVIDAAGSPYTRYATWATDPSVPANRTVHVQVGNLNSVTDAVLSPTGWGLYADNAYLKGIVSAANDVVRLDSGGVRLKMNATSFSGTYAYNFYDQTPTEAGGLYGRYQTGSTQTNEMYLRSIGRSGYRPAIGISAEGNGTLGGEAGLISISATGLAGAKFASITLDGGSPGVVTLSASDTINIVTTVKAYNVLPNTDLTYNLGSASLRWSTLYVDQLVAASIAGATLSGQEWEYAGSMTIDANSSSPTTVSVTNQGSGTAALDVEGNITLGGTVDGVDIAVHAANANAHHNQIHVLATTSALGADHTVSGLTAGMVLKATSATAALFVALAHSELTGLTTGDPHTQYVSLSTARTITAQHTFAPGSAQAPFVLGANAQSQLVTGLRADQLNKQVIAGSGLSGTGTLTADVTLAIAWGTPTISTITPDAAANAGSATTAARSDHIHAIVAAAPSVNLSVSTTNAEGSSTSFARADHAHAITTSSSPGATQAILATTTAGSLTLGTSMFVLDNTLKSLGIGVTPDGAATLDVVASSVSDHTVRIKQLASQTGRLWRIEDTSANELIVLDSVGNLQSGNPGFVSGLTGWQITPAGNAEFNNGFFRGALHATTFVVDEIHATGGTLFVATSGKLLNNWIINTTTGAEAVRDIRTTSVTGSGTQLDIRTTSGTGSGTQITTRALTNYLDIEDPPSGHAQMFLPGQILRLKSIGQLTGSLTIYDVWVRVLYNEDMITFWRYDVQIMSGGVNAVVMPAGCAVISYGSTGDGRILLTADLNYAPYIDVFTVGGLPWNGEITPHVRTGRLDGIGLPGISGVEQYGIVMGTDLSDANSQYIVASDQQLSLYRVDMASYNGVNQTMGLTADGQFKLGTDVQTDAGTGFDFDPASGILSIGNAIYPAAVKVVGSVTITGGSGYGNLSDRPTSLSGINSTEGTKLTGIETGATLGAVWGTNLTGRPVELTDGRVATALNSAGTVVTRVVPAALAGPGSAGLYLGSDYLGYYSGSAWKTYMDNAGHFFLSGTGSHALAWDGATLSITGNITITNSIPAGNISGLAATATSSDFASVTGTTKPANNATLGATWGTNLSGIPSTLAAPAGAGLYLSGTNLGYYNGSVWKTYMDNTGKFYFAGNSGATLAWDGTDLYGTDGATVQWYARASTGKLYAGAGSVTLDNNGVSITPSADLTWGLVAGYQNVTINSPQTYRFFDSTTGYIFGGVGAGKASSIDKVILYNQQSNVAKEAHVIIDARFASNGTAFAPTYDKPARITLATSQWFPDQGIITSGNLELLSASGADTLTATFDTINLVGEVTISSNNFLAIRTTS